MPRRMPVVLIGIFHEQPSILRSLDRAERSLLPFAVSNPELAGSIPAGGGGIGGVV
ncbi:MAG: hypothetical protein AB4040_18270 [Synechococcus sp.]